MTKDSESPLGAEPRRNEMSYQEIVDAWNRRPVSNRVGSRRFRRRLVVATYGGWLVVAVILRLTIWSSPNFGGLLVLVIMNSIVSAVWFGRKTYLNREVMETDAGLDERLVQNRNQAFRRAFQVFAPVALIAWLLSMVAMTLQPGDPGLRNAVLIFIGVALLGTTLPTAIVAWREPDPEP
jgi:hypothetical protein